MKTAAPLRVHTVALIGNPNTGKSTLFSALAGVRQHIGNYPGVTVEKKVGSMTHGGRSFALIDLPGTYSLAPRSPDEMVAVDVLFGRQAGTTRPDAVICIVDASNLERNLYLFSQVLELGLPTVLALNMTDAARNRGVIVDALKLSERLGVPVVEMQANRGIGIDQLKDVLLISCEGMAASRGNPFPQEFQDEVRRLESHCSADRAVGVQPRFMVERLLLDTSGYLQQRLGSQSGSSLEAEIVAARERLAKAGMPIPAVEAMARYGWVGERLQGVVERRTVTGTSLTDRIDRVLTHRVWGSLVFALMMIMMFQSVFRWAGPASDAIEAGFTMAGDGIQGAMAEGPLRSLLVDGIIGGVGGVLVFLPQILILFAFIAVLEDCGYMARAAYLMDKLMVRVGLSGKSFIPLLSSFACAIPGVMATRVIENRRDRLTTMMIAPLMSCSARIPVYILLIAAFVPDRAYLGGTLKLQGLVMVAMYLVGIVAAIVVALVLKRTLLRGPTPPFVMELPSYKMPSPRLVLMRMFDSGWSFVYRAGTLILAVSIVVWAALYYPHDAEQVEAPFAAKREVAQQAVDATLPGTEARKDAEKKQLAVEQEVDGAYERQSYLGRMGHFIEPVVLPLGWDWRIGAAAIASFPAREVVVATLGILYDVGGDLDVEEEEEDLMLLGDTLKSAKWDGTDRPVFTLATALSIMVFFALCAQCAATLAVIQRETNSWRWPVFTFVYMTVLAYVAAWATYQTAVVLGA